MIKLKDDLQKQAEKMEKDIIKLKKRLSKDNETTEELQKDIDNKYKLLKIILK